MPCFTVIPHLTKHPGGRMERFSTVYNKATSIITTLYTLTTAVTPTKQENYVSKYSLYLLQSHRYSKLKATNVTGRKFIYTATIKSTITVWTNNMFHHKFHCYRIMDICSCMVVLGFSVSCYFWRMVSELWLLNLNHFIYGYCNVSSRAAVEEYQRLPSHVKVIFTFFIHEDLSSLYPWWSVLESGILLRDSSTFAWFDYNRMSRNTGKMSPGSIITYIPILPALSVTGKTK